MLLERPHCLFQASIRNSKLRRPRDDSLPMCADPERNGPVTRLALPRSGARISS